MRDCCSLAKFSSLNSLFSSELVNFRACAQHAACTSHQRKWRAQSYSAIVSWTQLQQRGSIVICHYKLPANFPQCTPYIVCCSLLPILLATCLSCCWSVVSPVLLVCFLSEMFYPLSFALSLFLDMSTVGTLTYKKFTSITIISSILCTF